MKVRTLSYNGAANATTSFKNLEFVAQRYQYKSKIGKISKKIKDN